MTYRVPAGAQIIGAGGTDCVFIIENGGSVVAHSGNGNSYRVKTGGISAVSPIRRRTAR